LKINGPRDAADRVEACVRAVLAQFDDDDKRREILAAVERRVAELVAEEAS
jgi:hypothetical protein